MQKFKWLLSYPKLYAWIASKRKLVNYEKILYLNSINKGDITFDIGANIGSFTQLFSILCGSKGEVHCFEPIPETYQILSEKIKNLKNVIDLLPCMKGTLAGAAVHVGATGAIVSCCSVDHADEELREFRSGACW